MVSTLLPTAIGLRLYNMDLDQMLYNDEVRRKCYYLKEYVEDAKKVLERFERSGYFEDL